VPSSEYPCTARRRQRLRDLAARIELRVGRGDRQRRRAQTKRLEQQPPHQLIERPAEPAFQRKVQQHEARMRIDRLLAGRVSIVGGPVVERGNELRQLERFRGPGRMILREHKARGMGRELSQSDPANVSALLQLDHVLGGGIVQAELALLVGQRQQRGVEDLADRAEIEQNV
jgi:hypothetical protein